MIGKIATLFWFARRPSHWAHAGELARRKFRPNRDRAVDRATAEDWASRRVTNYGEALAAVGLTGHVSPLSQQLLSEARTRAERSTVRMGGAGDLDLLYGAVRLAGARRIVETGVAYGWSSLAILAALEDRPDGRLVSVDMPYPKMGNEAFVGIVVPERLRGSWTLIREPDRHGLVKAIELHGGQIDLAHYDSDKSWWGRDYALRRIWEALTPGGLLVCDDIGDNMYFAAFVEEKQARFAVTESGGKYVGVVVR